MNLPLSALLYKITSLCDYDLQNVGLSRVIDDIHLFDETQIESDHSRSLNFLTDTLLSNHIQTIRLHERDTQSIYLCYTNGDINVLKKLAGELKMVYLIPKHNESYQMVFNHLLNILQSFHTWNQTFHIELLHGAPMSQLLDTTAPILSHPMVVLDANMGIMGFVRKENEMDAYMESLIETGYMTPEMFKSFQQIGILPSHIHHTSLHIASYSDPEGASFYSMYYQIELNGQPCAYVLVFSCKSHPSNSYQYLMDMVVSNLTLYFRQNNAASSRNSIQSELFLAKLLTTPNQPLHRLLATLDMIDGLDLHGYFLLAKVYLTDQEKVSKSFITWQIRNTFRDLKPFVHEDNLYILRTADTEKDVLNAFLPTDSLSQLTDSFGIYLNACTISNPFYSLQDLPQAANQCEAAYDYCDSPVLTSRIIYYRDQIYSYMKHKLTPDIDCYMFDSPYYQSLKKYDAENDTNLTYIVYAYLINFKSIQQTALSCQMHRNTIQNNIKKAFQVLDNNLDNYDDTMIYIINYRRDHS